MVCRLPPWSWSSPLPPQGRDEAEPPDESTDERLRRRAYERGCQRLKKRIEGQAGVDTSATAAQTWSFSTAECFFFFQWWKSCRFKS